jgi:hypothetical protein
MAFPPEVIALVGRVRGWRDAGLTLDEAVCRLRTEGTQLIPLLVALTETYDLSLGHAIDAVQRCPCGEPFTGEIYT